MSNPNQLESCFHKTIFGTLEAKYNPQRWLSLYSLARAAVLNLHFLTL
jgi:hypothetical protein